MKRGSTKSKQIKISWNKSKGLEEKIQFVKTHQNVWKQIKMIETNSNWVKMCQNKSKWGKMCQNKSISVKLIKMSQK